MNQEFSYKSITGKSLMIIVPHQDDEINVTGATITGAISEGIEVWCVYITNGDWSYRASIRIREAIRALSVLGLKKDHIIILGYPDGGLHTERNIYMLGKKDPVVVNGRDRTYGIKGMDDFSFKYKKEHSLYTWNNLLTDLKECILVHHPETIIGTDFDSHPDHRMCSIALEEVLGNILNEKGNTYFPTVLKGFAYATSYESSDDFYGFNLKPSVVNMDKLCIPEDETDNPTYRWKERIRFPVPSCCRESFLYKNRIFKALTKHISQRAYQKATRIINSDQVFWERRTDNLIMKGRISVSSGEGRFLHDFKRFDVTDIKPLKVNFDKGIWVPDTDDNKKSVRVDFDQPQKVSCVVLYGNIEKTGRVMDLEIVFSTGDKIRTGMLPERGKSASFEFPLQTVSWIEFHILKMQGEKAGLGEIEIFEKPSSLISTLSVEVNGSIAYEWNWMPGETVHIAASAFHVDKNLDWTLDGKRMPISELNTAVNRTRKKWRVGVSGAGRYGESLIIPRGKGFIIWWQIRKKMDSLLFLLEHGKQKFIHRVLKLYRDQS